MSVIKTTLSATGALILWVGAQSIDLSGATPGHVLKTDGAGHLTLGPDAGSGELLANGTVPLTADWDTGGFAITGLQNVTFDATGPHVILVATAAAGAAGASLTTTSGAGGNGVGATPGGAGGIALTRAGSGGAGTATALPGVGADCTVHAGAGGANNGAGGAAGGHLDLYGGVATGNATSGRARLDAGAFATGAGGSAYLGDVNASGVVIGNAANTLTTNIHAETTTVSAAGAAVARFETGGVAVTGSAIASVASVGVTQSMGLAAKNPTVAALGAQQWSPTIEMDGSVWITDLAVPHAVKFRAQLETVQGTNATRTAAMRMGIGINGAAPTTAMVLYANGGVALNGATNPGGGAIAVPYVSGSGLYAVNSGGTLLQLIGREFGGTERTKVGNANNTFITGGSQVVVGTANVHFRDVAESSTWAKLTSTEAAWGAGDATTVTGNWTHRGPARTGPDAAPSVQTYQSANGTGTGGASANLAQPLIVYQTGLIHGSDAIAMTMTTRMTLGAGMIMGSAAYLAALDPGVGNIALPSGSGLYFKRNGSSVLDAWLNVSGATDLLTLGDTATNRITIPRASGTVVGFASSYFQWAAGTHYFYNYNTTTQYGNFTTSGLTLIGTCALALPFTDTSGTPGIAAVANTASGRCAYAAGNTVVTVTCSVCTANSKVVAQLETADATLTRVVVVPGAGSFTVTGNAAATGVTKFSFTVTT